MSSIAITNQEGEGVLTPLRRVLSFLLAVVAFDCYAGETEALFSLLPEQTSVAIEVNDFARAVATNADANSGTDPQWWGDFAETFGLAPQALANATTDALLRAEIFVGGSWEEVVVAKVSPEKVEPLLDAFRKEFGQSSETVEVGTAGEVPFVSYPSRSVVQGVCQQHLILATAAVAAQAIAERLATPDDKILLAGWENLSLLDGNASSDGLKLTWYAAPWLKEDSLAVQDEGANPSQKLKDAQRHGLTGIESMGGVVDYDGGLPAAAVTTVYAPRPWSATLKIFEHLNPDQDLRLPPWVPDDVEHLEVASLELPQAFEYVDALFDDFYADGIEGTYLATVQDIRMALKVDLQKDVYARMGRKICVLHTYAKENTARRILYAIETKSPQTAAEAVRKLMQDDPGHTEVAIEGHSEPMWLVAAEEPGGEDFVFMVANGFIFFTNDATLMHRVLQPDAKHALMQNFEVQRTFERILADVGQSPSFFALRGKGERARASKEDRPRPPLKMLFAGPKMLEMWSDEQSGDFLSAIFPNGEEFPVSVGFSEENGWRVQSRTLPHQGEKGTSNAHE